MREAITDKLNDRLQTPVASEESVGYVLMETRKLLEQTKRGDVYERLYFFCSWAIHPWLKKHSAREVVQPIDEAVTFMLESKEAKPQDFIDNPGLIKRHMDIAGKAFDVADFTAFQQQLIKFFGEQGINTDQIRDGRGWGIFFDYYSRVIEDCPLLCMDNSTKHVRRVLIRKAQNSSASTEVRIIVDLRWYWVKDDDTEVPIIKTTYLYPPS